MVFPFPFAGAQWLAGLGAGAGRLTSHWFEFAPYRYVGHRPDLQGLIAPAVRNAQLLWVGFGASFGLWVGLAVTSQVQGRSARQRAAVVGLLLAGYAGGGWLGQRGFQRVFADEYYTIWKYQYGEKVVRPALGAPALLPRALRDVLNPAEPWRSRDKLAVGLGFAGAPAAFPILQALTQDRTQDPELRRQALRSLHVLDSTRFHALLPTLPADTATALFRQHTQCKH